MLYVCKLYLYCMLYVFIFVACTCIVCCNFVYSGMEEQLCQIPEFKQIDQITMQISASMYNKLAFMIKSYRLEMILSYNKGVLQ